MDVMKSGLRQQRYVPLRAGLLARAQCVLDVLVFLCHRRADILVCMAFRQGLTGVLPAVVGVKVQQDTAGLQQPVPISVGHRHMGQRPGQVPGDNGIEAGGGKGWIFRVHHMKFPGDAQGGGGFAGLADHLRAQVDAGHTVAFRTQEHGKKASSGSNVQYIQLPSARNIFCDFLQPKRPFPALQLPDAELGEVLRPLGPVGRDAIFDCFHGWPPSIGFVLFCRAGNMIIPVVLSRKPPGGMKFCMENRRIHEERGKNFRRAPVYSPSEQCL